MIREIHIENFAVIDRADIEFRKGFNVITGETGAGKTILLSALSLLLGERGETRLIGKSSKQAVITGIFEADESVLSELRTVDMEVDNPLVIRRIIREDGRNSAYLNDIPVSVNILKQIGDVLADLHGQHEHQMLLKPKYQLDIIDSMAGNAELLMNFRAMSERLDQLRDDILSIKAKYEEFQKEREFIEYTLNELNALALDSIVEEELDSRLYELENAEEINESLSGIFEQLYGEDVSMQSILDAAVQSMGKIASKTQKAENLMKMLNEMNTVSSDMMGELISVQSSIVYDENELNELRKLASLIDDLKRKYRTDLQGLKALRDDMAMRMEEMEEPGRKTDELNAAVNEIRAELIRTGELLDKNRRESALLFEKSVNSILGKLNMAESRIKVKIDKDIESKRRDGMNELEMLLENKFTDGMPLNKIASGGELSRIMLAMKGTLTVNDPVQTMIFDEIDTGISGETAQKVSEIMSKIGKSKQLIAITHLPQIASAADYHILVGKKGSKVSLVELDDKQRIEEIARLLGSSMAEETALRHAKALLKKK